MVLLSWVRVVCLTLFSGFILGRAFGVLILGFDVCGCNLIGLLVFIGLEV